MDVFIMLLKGNYKKTEPASAAIIMANGIFLFGAVTAFPFIDTYLGKYLTLLLFVVWLFIYKDLSIQFLHRDFLIPFIKNPVNSFVIGTWIAGVSVLCNVFVKYFPEIMILPQSMAILNTFLWLFFLANCFYNFKQLFFDHVHYPVHGAILLSTVGTQSIIILLNKVFFQFSIYFSEAIIILGFLFYIAGITLIGNRYLKHKDWNLADDWANTNCIIHGALSITGLAIVVTNTFTPSFIIGFWIFVFILLIVVEALEVIRAIIRIRCYGWNEGLLNYDVSQWSRNFTFGMFYTFSMVMHQNPHYPMPDTLHNFQHGFMSIWAWVVLIAMVAQIAIYVKSRFIKVDKERLEAQ